MEWWSTGMMEKVKKRIKSIEFRYYPTPDIVDWLIS
jgi:hypothetical protein